MTWCFLTRESESAWGASSTCVCGDNVKTVQKFKTPKRATGLSSADDGHFGILQQSFRPTWFMLGWAWLLWDVICFGTLSYHVFFGLSSMAVLQPLVSITSVSFSILPPYFPIVCTPPSLRYLFEFLSLLPPLLQGHCAFSLELIVAIANMDDSLLLFRLSFPFQVELLLSTFFQIS